MSHHIPQIKELSKRLIVSISNKTIFLIKIRKFVIKLQVRFVISLACIELMFLGRTSRVVLAA